MFIRYTPSTPPNPNLKRSYHSQPWWLTVECVRHAETGSTPFRRFVEPLSRSPIPTCCTPPLRVPASRPTAAASLAPSEWSDFLNCLLISRLACLLVGSGAAIDREPPSAHLSLPVTCSSFSSHLLHLSHQRPLQSNQFRARKDLPVNRTVVGHCFPEPALPHKNNLPWPSPHTGPEVFFRDQLTRTRP